MIIKLSSVCTSNSSKQLDIQSCSLSAFHPSVEYSQKIFFLHFIPLKAKLKE